LVVQLVVVYFLGRGRCKYVFVVVGDAPSVWRASPDAGVANAFVWGVSLEPDYEHVTQYGNIAPHVNDLIEGLQRGDLSLVVTGGSGGANGVQAVEAVHEGLVFGIPQRAVRVDVEIDAGPILRFKAAVHFVLAVPDLGFVGLNRHAISFI
jgi:hypothetical protein